MASATRSCCARACPRRSANRCSNRPTMRSTCATARRRRISLGGPTCSRARARRARRSSPSTRTKVSIDVYRVGDRNLLATVNRDDFLKPIDSSRATEIASQDGAKVWSGTMDVASALNQDVVTDFPVLDAVGKLEPGVYVDHRAAVEGRGESGRRQTRTRACSSRRNGWWSRTLASPRSPATTACMRLCSRWARPGRSPASSSGSLRATTKCWRRRRPAPMGGSISIPGSRAARAVRRPASWSRRSPATMAFSASLRTRSTSPTAASPAAIRRPGSTHSSTPSAASTAPARPCSPRLCCATRRAWRNPACR